MSRDPVSNELSCAEDAVGTVIDDILERWALRSRLDPHEVLEALAILKDAHTHIKHALVLVEMQTRGAS